MQKLLYTSALIKALYNSGHDYLDSFWPFMIKVIPPEKHVDLKFVQGAVRQRFELEMPLHVVRTILNRAKKKGFVIQERKRYKLTEKGQEYLDKLETEREVERRINALLDDIELFFNENGVILSKSKINDLLTSFVSKSIEPLIEEFIMHHVKVPISSFGNKLKKEEKFLLQYIKNAEERKPEKFRTIRDIILGSIISTILYAKDPSNLNEITTKKFKKLQVFLDTNFVFSILDLHPPEFSKPARELFNMLKDYNFELKIFDFTVDEICRVIQGYIEESYRYIPSIDVDTVYSSLKKKGWTKTDVREFIINVENILKKENIKIEYTGISLNDYQPENKKLMNIIKKWKPYKPLSSQNHDIAAIEMIRKLRGHSIRKIEEAKAIFLTSDTTLSKLDFIEMGHKYYGTVSEVILDRLMACILWLKDPRGELPIKSIIAAHSREFFVSKGIWDRFYEVLGQLREEGRIDEESIAMLFYHNYIEDVLIGLEEEQAEIITPEFVLEKVQEAAKLKENEQKREIEKKEESLQKLEEKLQEKEMIIEEKEEKLRKIKNALKESSKRKAQKWADIIFVILAVITVAIIVIPIVVAVILNFNWIKDNPWVVTLFLGGSGLLEFIFKPLRKVLLKEREFINDRIRNRLEEKIFEKKLKEAKLENL